MKSSPRFLVLAGLFLSLAASGFAQHVIKTVNVGSGPNGIAVNTNTNVIYVSNSSTNTVSVIEGNSYTVTATVTVGNGPGPIAVYAPANLIFVYNTVDKTMSQIDGYTNKVNFTEALPFGCTAMVILGQSKYLYMSDTAANAVHVVDVTKLKKITDVSVPSPTSITANVKGKEVYVTSASTAIDVINTNTNSVIAAYYPPSNSDFSSISVDATDNLLFAATYASSSPTSCTVEVLNATTGALLGTSPAIGAVNQLYAMSGSKEVIASGGAGKTPDTITLVSGTTYKVKDTVTVGSNPTAIGYYPKTLIIYVTNQAGTTVSVVGS